MLGLAVIIIAVYILQIASSPYSHPVVSWVFLDLALNPLRIAGVTQAYTLFTSMFLHANLVHLIFNLFALILVGMAFESRIGSTRFFLIAIIAGLVGGLTWAVIHWGQDAFAVGASGAVLGAIGAFARLFGRERLRLILFVVPLPPMPAYLVFVLLLLIDLVIALTSVLPIAAEAHIGGAIAGFLIAPLHSETAHQAG